MPILPTMPCPRRPSVVALLVLTCLTLFLHPHTAGAETLPPAIPATVSELTDNAAHNTPSLAIVWTLLCGILALLVPIGITFGQMGLGRARNATHTLTLSLLAATTALLAFWIGGFALLSGGFGNLPAAIGWHPPLGPGLDWLNKEYTGSLLGKAYHLCGYRGFLLIHVFDAAILSLFFFQAAVLLTAVTIPAGALAERWNLRSAALYGAWIIIPYTLLGNWIWGGGWLAGLGVNFNLGHGTADFAGSSWIHLAGGLVGLIGAHLIGARLGRYGKDGRILPMPPHSLPSAFLGTYLVAVGTFGINAGATLAGADMRIAIVATNTLLAGAAGVAAAALSGALRHGRPDPALLCAGLLSGLAASAAPCAFVNPPAAVLIGLIAGFLVTLAIPFVERRLRIDDPAGAISIHGLGGAWGLLAVGLFANGSYGQGWGGLHRLTKNGQLQTLINDGTPQTLQHHTLLLADGWQDQGITGLCGKWFGAAYNDGGQLLAQLLALLATLLLIGSAAWIGLTLTHRIAPLRVEIEEEQKGLDNL